MIKNLSFLKPINFRKDINFLRFLAVIVVVIYHIEKSILPGGWLGVDIFFFISGYLISNKILNSLKQKQFSFSQFYINRIKRILPAYLSMIIFTLPFSYQLLPPKNLFDYIQSLKASLLLYSNFYFLQLDFYNSPSTKLMPLIHTWSLAIEEQYYILLPAILFLIFNKYKDKIFVFVFSIFSISIFMSFLTNENIVFYNTFFRIWEFLFGTIYLLLNPNFKTNKFIKTSGLIVVLFCFIYFDDSTITYTYNKILCLFGLFLFLLGENQENYINKIINLKLFQHLGLISYSIYLFHQPVFAFLNIYLFKNSIEDKKYLIFAILFLYIISFLNWKFIEKPFSSIFSKNKKILLSTTYLLITIATFIVSNDNFILNKYTDIPKKVVLLSFKNQDVISKDGKNCEDRSINNLCNFKIESSTKNIYVLGDSSLRTVSTALLKEQRNYSFNLIHVGGSSCLYLISVKITKDSCPNRTTEEMDQFVNQISNSIIIYGGRLPLYLSGTGFDNSFVKEDNEVKSIENLESKILSTINALSQNNTVVLMYPIPEQGWNVPNLYFYNQIKWGETVSYPSAIWYERVSKSTQILDKASSTNIIRIFPQDLFCDSYVKNQCVGAINNTIFYSDDDHLSIEGAELIVDLIIENLFKEN